MGKQRSRGRERGVKRPHTFSHCRSGQPQRWPVGGYWWRRCRRGGGRVCRVCQPTVPAVSRCTMRTGAVRSARLGGSVRASELARPGSSRRARRGLCATAAPQRARWGGGIGRGEEGDVLIEEPHGTVALLQQLLPSMQTRRRSYLLKTAFRRGAPPLSVLPPTCSCRIIVETQFSHKLRGSSHVSSPPRRPPPSRGRKYAFFFAANNLAGTWVSTGRRASGGFPGRFGARPSAAPGR